MRNILIYSTAYFPFVGGAEVAVKELTDKLPGFNFTLITAKMDQKLPREEQIGRVKVFRIGFGIKKIDKLYLALFGHRLGIKLHKKENFQAVWSIMASYCGFAALRFKELSGVKFLLTLQEGDPFDYILKKVRFCLKRFKKIFSSADALQPISKYLFKWGKDMGFKGNVAKVIPNGVDLDKFILKNESERPIFRKRIIDNFNLKSDAKIVITASRLTVKNGVGDIIKSLPPSDSRAVLLIAGIGELENELRSLVNEIRIKPRVIFLGKLGHDELPEYFWGSDIFCRPSLSEGLGNAFLEAMAAGLPAIATPVGGIPDFLLDGETGLFCEVNNPRDIAAKVDALIENEDLKIKLIKNGRRLVQENYSWDLISQDMNNLIVSLINL